MKVLVSKNGYLLVRLNGAEGSTAPLYSYGSAECMNPAAPLTKGTKDEMLQSCRKDLRHCKGRITKYSKKDMPAIVNLLKQQESALIAFVAVLKGL